MYQNFTCAAYPGHQLADFLINGSSAGPLATYSFLPTGNTSLYLSSTDISSGVSGGGIPQSTTTVIQQTYPTPTPLETTINPLVNVGIVFLVIVLMVAVILGYAQTQKPKKMADLFKGRK